MNRSKLIVSVGVVTAIAAAAGMMAFAQPAKDGKTAAPAGHPEMKLPPGWTKEDCEACGAAAIPGKMHEQMAKGVGVWYGKTQMWMPGSSEAMHSTCVNTVTSIMDGRYIKWEMSGDFPGMGPYTGLGIRGFDNVTQKVVGSWFDNCRTDIMNGTAEFSKDGNTLTWQYTYNCPIRKKPAIARQVETYTSPTTMTFESFTTDPKSGKEYQCIRVDFTKKS